MKRRFLADVVKTHLGQGGSRSANHSLIALIIIKQNMRSAKFETKIPLLTSLCVHSDGLHGHTGTKVPKISTTLSNIKIFSI